MERLNGQGPIGKLAQINVHQGQLATGYGPKKESLEKWYSALGIISGFLGVASLVVRMWIMGLDKEKEEKGYSPPYIAPLPKTLHDLSY